MSSPENFDFIDAVRRGDVSQVEELLKGEGKSLVNQSHAYGISPLKIAWKNGHLKVIELLLEKGAKADKSDLEAYMELTHELIVKVVSKLLKNNPEVEGWHDAMLKACEMGYPELVEVFLQYEKWDMSPRDCKFQYGQHSCYEKALQHAACSGEVKVLKLLLNSKQSAEVTPKVMTSLVYDACESDSPEMVRFLLTHEKLSGTDAVNHIFPNRGYAEESALMKATRKGHNRVVKQLLECGAKIDLQNYTGKSALMVAVRERQSKTAEILIDKGAKVDLEDSSKLTALSEAVSIGFLEGVKLLLENNASIEIWAPYTPLLHQAVKLKNTHMVKLLLEQGAPVNSRDRSRQTALMKASDLELIKLLLDNGADSRLFDSNGEYALLHLVKKKIYYIQNIWTQLNYYWKREQMPPQFQIGGCQPRLS